MNENLDLVKILQDCLKGTKLYSPVIGDVILYAIRNANPYPIEVVFIDDRGEECTAGFTSDGRFNVNLKNSECMLFPSKECHDWSQFKPQQHKPEFQEGDHFLWYNDDYKESLVVFERYTNEEKCAIKVFSSERHFYYREVLPKSLLKLDKFDAKFLHEFDKVLVRDTDKDYWNVNLFGDFCETATCRKFSCIASLYSQCIPYNDETAPLLGTDRDCPEFYKIW